jgi:cytosine/adenosine deaminase-related metal-dependent hydrolase
MRFLKADRLFNGRGYLEDNRVLVLDDKDRLQEIIPGDSLEAGRVEKLDGILSPGFVNAHCHLELSHLKDNVTPGTGLPAFAQEIVTRRNLKDLAERKEARRQADVFMWERGIVAVGDISNTAESFDEKTAGQIHYHTFIELIGLNPAMAETLFGKGLSLLEALKARGLSGSLAPHAPYSTSLELIRLISAYNAEQDLPFSIHHQESEAENDFLEGRPSAFENLYRALGIDLSWFRAPGLSGLAYYQEALPPTPALLVHNTLSGPEDWIRASGMENLFRCLCPRANRYIENRLPDLSLLPVSAGQICLGTDSLASNTSLDLVEEANLILSENTWLSPEFLLQAMTCNGAQALGLSGRYGQFLPGHNAGLNLLKIQHGQIQFIRKIA